MLARRAHLHPAQAEAIDAFSPPIPTRSSSRCSSRSTCRSSARARHLLAAYGDDAAAIGGLADVLFGGTCRWARLPISRLQLVSSLDESTACCATACGEQFTGAVARIEHRGSVVFERAYGSTRDDALRAPSTSTRASTSRR